MGNPVQRQILFGMLNDYRKNSKRLNIFMHDDL